LKIEAVATGRLTQILVQADSVAAVGDQVAWIESAETQGAGAKAAAPSTPEPRCVAPTPSTAAISPRDAERIRSTPSPANLPPNAAWILEE